MLKSKLILFFALSMLTLGALSLILHILFLKPTWEIRDQFTDYQWEVISDMAQTPTPINDPSNTFSDHRKAIAFGKKLFFHKGFSKNNQISCSSCHVPEKHWTDGNKIATGIKKGKRNTPTLLNTSHNRWFFWDGRADSQWSQALQPIETEEEMGNTRLSVLHHIHQVDSLKQDYEKIFKTSLAFLQDTVSFPTWGSPIIPYGRYNPWLNMQHENQQKINHHFANLGKAIAAFESTIVSPPSTFDKFIRSINFYQPKEYPHEALNGLKIFMGKGKCFNCHSGNLFTNKEFHNIRLNEFDGARYEGIRKLLVNEFNQNSPYSDDTSISKIEYVKLVKRNWGEFKVPSLRNVAHTAPYMHDGRFATIEDVVAYYSELKNAIPDNHVNETIIKPLHLTDKEKKELVAFLRTL